jgi:hypothetical protein
MFPLPKRRPLVPKSAQSQATTSRSRPSSVHSTTTTASFRKSVVPPSSTTRKPLASLSARDPHSSSSTLRKSIAPSSSTTNKPKWGPSIAAPSGTTGKPLASSLARPLPTPSAISRPRSTPLITKSFEGTVSRGAKSSGSSTLATLEENAIRGAGAISVAEAEKELGIFGIGDIALELFEDGLEREEDFAFEL